MVTVVMLKPHKMPPPENKLINERKSFNRLKLKYRAASSIAKSKESDHRNWE